MSSSDEISNKLTEIERRLESQERIAFRRFHWSLSIAFIGLGLGAALASRSLEGTEATGLSAILLFGGILLMYLTQLELSQDYYKKTAWWGFGVTVIGVAMVAIPLLANWSGNLIWADVMAAGWLAIPVGIILMLIATKPFKRNR